MVFKQRTELVCVLTGKNNQNKFGTLKYVFGLSYGQMLCTFG